MDKKYFQQQSPRRSEDEWQALLLHHRDGSDGGDASAEDPVIRGEGDGLD